MSTPTTTTTTEERQRLQHRYERLLRERAAASLMGEAAAAAAAAEAHQARHGVGTNRSWYPPSFLQASTEGNTLVINPSRIEAAIAELSDTRNINLTPRPAHQPAAALQGTRAHSGVAAPSPPAAASPTTCRYPECQPLDLSCQPSHQWRHIGGPSYVYGRQPAVTSAATSAAYMPSTGAYAAYSQAAGPSYTYSQVPRHFTTYGPVAGPSAVQPQPARSTATCPHVAGYSSTYNPAETEAAQLPPMGDHRMQASSFETYGEHYSEQQSITSTLRHVYYAPQMVSTASHYCPLDNAGSSQGPAPLEVYPPMMMPSSEGAVPWTGYAPVNMVSSEWAVTHTGYPPVVTYNEWAARWAGYVPVVPFGASYSQAQMVPHYGYGVPPPTAGYQQTWPAVSVYQQASMAQGHPSGPSRNRPTKRPVPFSDRRTSFRQPRNLRSAAGFGSRVEAGPSTRKAPSQGPLKATVEGPTSAMKSGPVKFSGGGRESVPVGRIAPVEKKSDDQVSGTSIKKVPEGETIVKQDVADGQDKTGSKSKAETNPEINADQVADIDPDGGAPVADNEAGEAERQVNVAEYERGPDDGESADESSSSDGESGQQPEVRTWQQQLRVPPRTPWEAEGFADAPAAPRPSSYQDYVRLATPGPRCICYCCAAGESGPSAARGLTPVSATLGAAGIATSTSTGSASTGRTGPASAEASAVPQRSVITVGPPSAQGRSFDSSVKVDVVSESEYESYSADDGEEAKKESKEVEEEGEEETEGNEEGDEGEKEEEDDDDEDEEDEEVSEEDKDDRNEDQEDPANEAVQIRRNPQDIPQQETSQSTSGSPEAREEHEEVEQSSEEAER